jgi:hypothetical protein
MGTSYNKQSQSCDMKLKYQIKKNSVEFSHYGTGHIKFFISMNVLRVLKVE